jgi:N-acetylmuramoyl-L-alanine amidase
MRYAVKQGDYLAKIANEHGFADWRVIWNDSENAALRKLRGNPNVLYPGDELHIPERITKEESAATEKRHRFVALRAPLRLRLVLKDFGFKPIADEKCVLDIDGERFPLVTDGKGLVERPIEPTAQNARLWVLAAQSPFADDLAIQIGHLDPLDTVTGQTARLNNLGYFAGPMDKQDEALFKSAVEEFQCDHALTVDGKCGPKTQAKLKEICGS